MFFLIMKIFINKIGKNLKPTAGVGTGKMDLFIVGSDPNPGFV